MIKKILVGCALFVVLYAGIIWLQVFWVSHFHHASGKNPVAAETTHKLYSFSFAKYTASGEKEIEIEGDSANILAKTVDLLNGDRNKMIYTKRLIVKSTSFL